MKVGIIAEDNSDVDVVKALTVKMLKPKAIGFKSFVGKGGGRVRKKCGAWATTLIKGGCAFLVVVHDRDHLTDHDEQKLRKYLLRVIAPAKAQISVVLIPKREIEAWLLYDTQAIATAFRESKKVKVKGSPEDLADPKSTLEDLVWTTYGKDYVNTIHNAQIAQCGCPLG